MQFSNQKSLTTAINMERGDIMEERGIFSLCRNAVERYIVAISDNTDKTNSIEECFQ